MKKLIAIVFLIISSLSLYFFNADSKKLKIHVYQLKSADDDMLLGMAFPISDKIAIMSYHQYELSRDKMSLIAEDEREIPVKKIYAFPEIDIVFISPCDGVNYFNDYYSLMNSDELHLGDNMFAVGVNRTIGSLPLITKGIFSGRTTKSLTGIFPVICSAIVSDARTNSGFSGGPLLDKNFNVAGMICGRIFPTPEEASIGAYSVPSNLILRALESRGKKTFYYKDLRYEIRLKSPSKALYSLEAVVLENFNGVLLKDDVIKKVDNLCFYSENDLDFILSTSSGHVNFTIIRNGTEHNLSVEN